MELFKHQNEIADFIGENLQALVLADPGTGKTAAVLTAINNARAVKPGRALVVCPKSIMGPAWAEDCEKFTPELSLTIAQAPEKNRRKAFKSNSDIVVINHDGVVWLAKHPELLDDFVFLAMDESTAFKNKDAARSKAIASIKDLFTYRVAMTGTPMSNDILDVWHQAFLVDDGEHLGRRFYAFRAATHEPEPVTRDINKWVPKEGAVEVITDLLAPISLRYKLEDCVDMPPHHMTCRQVDLGPKLREHYERMKARAVLQLSEDRAVEGVHAAALLAKLQQIASGAVYDEKGDAYELAAERYDLIAQLVYERKDPCIIGFTWKHQRDGLVRALERIGIDNFAVLDGDHNYDTRDLVKRFQAGEYRCLLAHPQTAGHGLTLTRAKTTIWASPIFNAELFEQLNRRIYRTGQADKTETIVLLGKDTVDEQVWAKLTGKVETQNTALELLKMLMPTQTTRGAA